MAPFKFVEDVSIADVAFEATGKDLEELLAACGEATLATAIRDTASVAPRVERVLSLEAEDPEMLVHRFLQELIFLKDAEQLLLSRFDARVRDTPQGLAVEVVARGEKLDPARHEQQVDVKAATWHRFEVEHTPQGWRAFVVLDT